MSIADRLLKRIELRTAKQLMHAPARPSLEIPPDTVPLQVTSPLIPDGMLQPMQQRVVPKIVHPMMAPTPVDGPSLQQQMKEPQEEPQYQYQNDEAKGYYAQVLRTLGEAATQIAKIRDTHGGRITSSNRSPAWLNYHLPGGPPTSWTAPGSSARIQNEFLAQLMIDLLDNASYLGIFDTEPVIKSKPPTGDLK